MTRTEDLNLGDRRSAVERVDALIVSERSMMDSYIDQRFFPRAAYHRAVLRKLQKKRDALLVCKVWDIPTVEKGNVDEAIV